ncbi:MAG TPA: diguanylate cyclase [Pseudomonas sp.]|nr:diguanylate cyclase [Pseudomonas sp.]
MGAGSPANTGNAGATHRGVCFAGMPAPTVTVQGLNQWLCLPLKAA